MPTDRFQFEQLETQHIQNQGISADNFTQICVPGTTTAMRMFNRALKLLTVISPFSVGRNVITDWATLIKQAGQSQNLNIVYTRIIRCVIRSFCFTDKGPDSSTRSCRTFGHSE